MAAPKELGQDWLEKLMNSSDGTVTTINGIAVTTHKRSMKTPVSVVMVPTINPGDITKEFLNQLIDITMKPVNVNNNDDCIIAADTTIVNDVPITTCSIKDATYIHYRDAPRAIVCREAEHAHIQSTADDTAEYDPRVNGWECDLCGKKQIAGSYRAICNQSTCTNLDFCKECQ